MSWCQPISELMSDNQWAACWKRLTEGWERASGYNGTLFRSIQEGWNEPMIRPYDMIWYDGIVWDWTNACLNKSKRHVNWIMSDLLKTIPGTTNWWGIWRTWIDIASHIYRKGEQGRRQGASSRLASKRFSKTLLNSTTTENLVIVKLLNSG